MVLHQPAQAPVKTLAILSPATVDVGESVREPYFHSLPLTCFEGCVCLYILQKPTLYFGNRIREPEWEMNAIELLTPKPVRGVLLHWLPPVINKQGAFKKERLENPDAALLAQRLSQFLGLTNHGFVGEKQRTAPLALHSPEKSQFERMFF